MKSVTIGDCVEELGQKLTAFCDSLNESCLEMYPSLYVCVRECKKARDRHPDLPQDTPGSLMKGWDAESRTFWRYVQFFSAPNLGPAASLGTFLTGSGN